MESKKTNTKRVARKTATNKAKAVKTSEVKEDIKVVETAAVKVEKAAKSKDIEQLSKDSDKLQRKFKFKIKKVLMKLPGGFKVLTVDGRKLKISKQEYIDYLNAL